LVCIQSQPGFQSARFAVCFTVTIPRELLLTKLTTFRLGKDDDAENVKVPESHVILELVADLYKDTEKSIYPPTAVARAEARYFIGSVLPSSTQRLWVLKREMAAERFNQVIQSNLMPILLKGDNSGAPTVLKGIEEIQTLLQRHKGVRSDRHGSKR